MLPRALKISGSMPYLMLCTEPSAKTALIPAGWAEPVLAVVGEDGLHFGHVAVAAPAEEAAAGGPTGALLGDHVEKPDEADHELGVSWYLPAESILNRKNLPLTMSPWASKEIGWPRIEVDSLVCLIASSTLLRLGV